MNRLSDILPDFFAEIRRALLGMQESELHEQLSTLTIERWTWDPVSQAMYLYVGGVRPLNAVEGKVMRVRHDDSIPLDDCDGTVVIDVDNFARVMGIEVLNRSDVFEILSKTDIPLKKLC